MERSSLRRTVIGAALVTAVLAGCAATKPVAPVVAAPPPAVVVVPVWMNEARDDADRALLARLLDPKDDVRAAAVAEWDAARMAVWDAVFKLPRDDWPLPQMPRGDWPAAHQETPPHGESARIVWAFENRTRALARGLIAALRDGDAATRVAAATSMSEMQLSAGRQLTQALEDPSAEVRLAAAQALTGQVRFESKYPACLPAMRKLLDDPDWRVRAAGARGLATFHEWDHDTQGVGKEALPRLMELADDEHAEVRDEALGAVAEIGWHEDDHAPLDALFARALDDASPEPRRRALLWFTQVTEYLGAPPPPVIERLRASLTFPDARVRRCAATAVWVATHDAASVVDVFAKSLADCDSYEIVEPLGHLTEIGPDAAAAVPAILGVLTVCKSIRKHASGTEAIDALYAIGPSAASTLPLLTPMLDDSSPGVRAEAARAVATLDGDAPACDAVLARQLAKETDPYVRHAIHAARGELGVGGAPLLADLVAGLRASDEVERAGALLGWQSLGRKAAPAAPEALESLLAGGGADWTRDQARVALAPVGGARRGFKDYWPGEPAGWVSERFLSLGPLGPEDAPAAPALVAALDVEWPYEAGRALASIGPAAKDVLPELRRRLAGPPSAQRVAAAEAALVIGGDADALAALVDAVETGAARPETESGGGGPGTAAAWALSRAGEAARPALSALRKAAESDGSDLQIAAVCALARLGDGDRVPAIVERIDGYYRFSTPPVELVETLAALGPAAAPAAPALERVATSWERETFKEEALDLSRAAIRALGRIGPGAASALPSLRKLRRNALLRAAADEAIRRIERR